MFICFNAIHKRDRQTQGHPDLEFPGITGIWHSVNSRSGIFPVGNSREVLKFLVCQKSLCKILTKFASFASVICITVSQSVSGTLDRPRVVAPSKTCGHVRSSRRRWRWAQCRPWSAAPMFGRVVLAGASTPAWCPVYRLYERPQPGVVRSGLVSLPVVAARDQKWRVASDKSGLLSLFRQFG